MWSFPDAANFGGQLLDKNGFVSAEMEEYSLEVLLCFCPFRTYADLMINHSHTNKFRQWYCNLKNTSPNEFTYIHRILTNIQCFKNSLRICSKNDILCENTEMFIDPDATTNKKKNSYSNDKEKALYTKEVHEFIKTMLVHEQKNLPSLSFKEETNFSLFELQKKGHGNVDSIIYLQ